MTTRLAPAPLTALTALTAVFRFSAEPTDDEIGAGSDEDADDAASADAGPRRKHLLPASSGLSVLVPPTEKEDMIRATVTWADYRAGWPRSVPATP